MSQDNAISEEERELIALLDQVGVPASAWYELDEVEQQAALDMLVELSDDGFSESLDQASGSVWDEPPPDVYTILTDPYYLGGVGGGDLYPCLIEDMVEIFTSPNVIEVVLTGAIGWGKSYFAALGIAIELILLLHLKDPQEYCGVAKKTKISLVNMSVSADNAEGVLYDKVFQFLKNCPWIQDRYPIDDYTECFFEAKNISFRPGNSSELSVIGEDLIGAALDEANFMVSAKRSKRAILAGEYDVAKIIYDAIARRRTSRFVGVLGGKVIPPAHMWLISSKQFPGDFLEQRIDAIRQAAREGAQVKTKVIDYAQWETRLSLPADKIPYCGLWFALFVGDAMHESRIIDTTAEHESAEEAVASFDGDVPDGCEVIGVPVEYLSAFIEDLYGAIRDFAGRAILASKPFFSDTPAFADMICNEEIGDVQRAHPYQFTVTDVVSPDLFVGDNIPVRYLEDTGLSVPFLNPDEPRVAHFDQSITGDYTGFAICHFGGYKQLKLRVPERYQNIHGETCERFIDVLEHRPIVVCDFMIRVAPPVGGRIDLDPNRSLLYTFARLAGVKMWHKITYDQFESESQIAALRKEGYPAEKYSVDRNSGECYGYLRSAISDRRFSCYEYEPFVEDLASIERTAKGKVDHRKGGTKDVSDCVAACCRHIEERHTTYRTPLITDAGRDSKALDHGDRFAKQVAPGHMPDAELQNTYDPFVLERLIRERGLW